MYRNVTFDFLIGLVPVLGDIADAVYKCNTKNYVLLEKELVKRAKQRALGGDVSGVAAVSNSYQNYNTSGAQYQMADPYGGNPQYASNRQQRRPA